MPPLRPDPWLEAPGRGGVSLLSSTGHKVTREKEFSQGQEETTVPRGPGPISVVLAIDGSFVGDGLVSQLAGVADVNLVGRSDNHLDLFELLTGGPPQAVIISGGPPFIGAMTAEEVTRRLRREFVDLGIVIVAHPSEPQALEAVCDGAPRTVFLSDGRPLDMDDVLGALRLVCEPQSPARRAVVDAASGSGGTGWDHGLSNREPRVLEQMAEGRSNRAIASGLNISFKSIEKDASAIFRKLGLGDPTAVDRRVTATLSFLRSSTGSFVTGSGSDAIGSDAIGGGPWHPTGTPSGYRVVR